MRTETHWFCGQAAKYNINVGNVVTRNFLLAPLHLYTGEQEGTEGSTEGALPLIRTNTDLRSLAQTEYPFGNLARLSAAYFH